MLNAALSDSAGSASGLAVRASCAFRCTARYAYNKQCNVHRNQYTATAGGGAARNTTQYSRTRTPNPTGDSGHQNEGTNSVRGVRQRQKGGRETGARPEACSREAHAAREAYPADCRSDCRRRCESRWAAMRTRQAISRPANSQRGVSTPAWLRQSFVPMRTRMTPRAESSPSK